MLYIISVCVCVYICSCTLSPSKKGKTDHLFWFHWWIFQLTIPMTGSKMIESCYRNSNHCYDELYLMVMGYGQWLSSGVPQSSVRVPKNESLQTIRSVAFEVYPIRSWYPFCAELHGDTHGAMAASLMGFSHKWTVNHLFLWAIYTMAMSQITRGYHPRSPMLRPFISAHRPFRPICESNRMGALRRTSRPAGSILLYEVSGLGGLTGICWALYVMFSKPIRYICIYIYIYIYIHRCGASSVQ